MRRLSLSVCLLLLVTPAAAGEEVDAPSLDYIEISTWSYLQSSEDEVMAVPARREGEAAAIAFSWQASDYIAIMGRALGTVSEPEYGFADLERDDRQYELAMAFVAPFESSRLLVELGIADEALEFRLPDGSRVDVAASPGVYAAFGWRHRLGWFEYGARTAGQSFHGARRQAHSADLRFHLGDHFALGLNYTTWERDFLRAEYTGLGMQFKF